LRFISIIKGISENSVYPFFFGEGGGVEVIKARFLEMP
jgi:hypothetical protein